jgi:hypothetical protein
MTLIRVSALTIVALVGFAVQADAQTPCPELARLRSVVTEALKQAMRVSASERCGSHYRLSRAAEAMIEYANTNRDSCDISVQSLNEMEEYHRKAVKTRDNACAGRPLHPYGADIIQR